MAHAFKCGDSECWCATMTGIVIATDSKEKPEDLQRHPFHRGWWRERERKEILAAAVKGPA